MLILLKKERGKIKRKSNGLELIHSVEEWGRCREREEERGRERGRGGEGEKGEKEGERLGGRKEGGRRKERRRKEGGKKEDSIENQSPERLANLSRTAQELRLKTQVTYHPYCVEML